MASPSTLAKRPSRPILHTLLLSIRGLSNEITVRALSSQLGISYSTLSRCKNGVWPRSITFDAVRSTLDAYCDRFFGEDRQALATSLLTQLERQDVPTSSLAQILEQDGYDAMATALLVWAENPDAPEPEPSKPASPAAKTTMATPADPPAAPPREAILALPLVVILLAGLLKMPLSSLLNWAATHRAAYVGTSLLIACSPGIMGLAVGIRPHANARRD